MNPDHGEDPFFGLAVTASIVIAIALSVVAVVALAPGLPTGTDEGDGHDMNGTVPGPGSTTTTVAPATTTSTTTTVAPSVAVGLSMIWTPDGKVVVRGIVQSDEQAGAVEQAASDAFGDRVEDITVQVDDSGPVDADAQVTAFITVLAEMPGQLDSGSLALRDGALRLEGVLQPGQSADVFDELLDATGVPFTTDLTETAETASFRRELEVRPDGLVLSGTVASDAEAATLEQAARERFATLDVRTQLTVAEVSSTTGVVVLIGEVGPATAEALREFALVVAPPEDDDGEVAVTVDDRLVVSEAGATVESLNALFVLEPIGFDDGSAEILPESAPTIDAAAESLAAVPGTRVRIEAHTDSEGDEELNQQLSQARAESVAAALVERGIPAEDLEAVGIGEGRPIADNSTEEGRQANQRIRFALLTDQGA